MLGDRDFVEIETPTLTRSTPEGARDFLVPARLAPGSWYALPQSPQLFKQLLMVAGMERYYQIARCYRDEDFRADRQPEFTQLDIEMSFVEQDDVIELGEAVVPRAVAAHRRRAAHPVPADDLRRGDGALRLRQARPALRQRARRVHRVLRRHAVPGLPERLRRRGRHARRREPAAQAARRLAGVGQAARRPRPGLRARAGRRQLGGPVAKNLTEAERAGLAEHVGATARRLHLLRRRAPKASRGLLGAARLEIGRRCELIDEEAWSFLWVVDAPLFEPAADAVASGDVAVGAGAWTAVHHAFTSPKAEFLDTFDTDPGPALAYAYDIVCNGNEIGGGSIRIHRRDVQERVFKVMGLSEEEAQEKFGFLLDAFAFGAPPHGGIAFGWDRIVHAARRHRLDPRRHRLPEVRRRLRPADRGAGADHARAAQGGRRRQPAPGIRAEGRPARPPWRPVRGRVQRWRNASSSRLNSSACEVLMPCGPPSTTCSSLPATCAVGALPRLLEGHDGVGVAVDDERRHGDRGQVGGEVGGPRADALPGGVHVGLQAEAERLLLLRLGDLQLAAGAEEVAGEAVEEAARVGLERGLVAGDRVVVEGAVGVVAVELEAGGMAAAKTALCTRSEPCAPR